MTTPLVSCVIIFYNAEPFLDEAIESVFAQRYPDWELILVDDGSTDGSGVIAARWAATAPARVRVLQHPGGVNRGMSASRNLGMAHAGGEYVAFLDADDVWLPEKLAEQVAIMQAHPEVEMVFGATSLNDVRLRREFPAAADRIMQPSAYWDGPVESALYRDVVVMPPVLAVTLSPLGNRCCPSTSNFLFKRSVALAVDGFEETFRNLGEDQVFQTKMFVRSPVYVSSAIWDRVRMHPESCVATAERAGRLREANRVLLSWLGRYLRQRDLLHGELAAAYDRATWPFRHPVRHRVREGVALLIGLPGRLVRKLRREARRLRRPEPPPPSGAGIRPPVSLGAAPRRPEAQRFTDR